MNSVATETQYVTVGKLGRTRGVHGEIWITPTTDFPERFLGLKEIYMDNRGVWEKVRIRSSRIISGRPVVALAEITSPEEASRLTNRELALPREQLVKLPEDRHYIFEVVGCLAYASDSGELLGEIVDVAQYPANDVYVIRKPDGGETVCPAIKQFVVSIDTEKKRVTLVTDGLLDSR
ncbi:16S rRNA processing protein RimM [candidate division GN15 bacterium]|uniref:Ribosome maturation factor RimM n=1 Tax=candidate division GN15 bacterium TaxID=2072418 RepID=A0A855X2R7_9BACT|nr:MAG: 16S rRNA processing protein RimM [candidate division GN15 bacterium]